MQLPFLKMHGNGNDFVVVLNDGSFALPDRQHRARLGHRRLGIGFDQLMWVDTQADARCDAHYRVFNADGGEVQQCGNGVRSVARAMFDRMPERDVLTLRCQAGDVEARRNGDEHISVSMGSPVFSNDAIPFVANATRGPESRVSIVGEDHWLSVLSMGNPHAVFQVDDVEQARVQELGAALQDHPQFPERVNAGFMSVKDRSQISLRVYERGVGETLACGTGACAAVVAGRRLDLLDETVDVHLPGGRLVVSFRGNNDGVWLTGPAEHSFEGTVTL